MCSVTTQLLNQSWHPVPNRSECGLLHFLADHHSPRMTSWVLYLNVFTIDSLHLSAPHTKTSTHLTKKHCSSRRLGESESRRPVLINNPCFLIILLFQSKGKCKHCLINKSWVSPFRVHQEQCVSFTGVLAWFLHCWAAILASFRLASETLHPCTCALKNQPTVRRAERTQRAWWLASGPLWVLFIWITEVWWNLLMPGWSTEFTILRISFVLSILLRDGKVEVKKNRELLWLYTALLAPRCSINTARMGVPEDSYSWCPRCKPFHTLEG